MDRVKDKVALVTGGAKGIGKSACLLLAREGAAVVVTDIDDAAGQKVVEEIRREGGKGEFYRLDVSSEEEVQKVMASAAEKFGGIDILVNNAGIAGINKPTDQIPAEEWDKVIRINVNGVFFCTKHVIPYMKKAGGGSIINLSSIYGLVGAPDLPPYHASKGAVRLMTKTDAMLYAGDKIRVNSVHPAYIWTPLVEELAGQSPDGPEAFRRQLADQHPLGHVGQPDDVGYGIVYLASDESAFVTGSELLIDGGYTAR